jgi:hypothetical protein
MAERFTIVGGEFDAHTTDQGEQVRAPWEVPDEKPADRKPVKLYSKWPSQGLLVWLAQNGYPLSAVLCGSHTGRHIKCADSNNPLNDGDNDPVLETYPQEDGPVCYVQDPEHVYILASGGRETTQGGGYTEDQVMGALRKMRLDGNTQGAVYDVLVKRQPVPDVAKARGLARRGVESACYRAAKRINAREAA